VLVDAAEQRDQADEACELRSFAADSGRFRLPSARQMRRVLYRVAASIDGYIAGPRGEQVVVIPVLPGGCPTARNGSAPDAARARALAVVSERRGQPAIRGARRRCNHVRRATCDRQAAQTWR
jgi:hypothetical protein